MPETIAPLGKPQTVAGSLVRGEKPVSAPMPEPQAGDMRSRIADYMLGISQEPPQIISKEEIREAVVNLVDTAQQNGSRAAAGVLVSTVLANSAPAVSPASAEPAGHIGQAVTHSEKDHRPAKTGERIITLPKGGNIYDIAVPIARQRGINPNVETHQIEQASGVYSEAQAEKLQPGFKLRIQAAGVPTNTTYIREPLGSNLSTTAAENGLTLNRLLNLNPKYWSHPDQVQAGAYLRISGNTYTASHKPHETPSKRPEHHMQAPVLPSPQTHAARHKAAQKPAIKLNLPVFPDLHLNKWLDTPTHDSAARPHKSFHKPAARHHAAPHAASSETRPVKTNYDIHSDVLSKSGLTAQALQAALSKIYPSEASLAADFHKVEQKYGINALYVAAAAAQESAGATSNLAKDRNNLFGINAVDSDPNKAFGYKDKAASIDAFARLLAKAYLHSGGQYFNGSSLHGIYKDYSTSHDLEAGEIASIMNSLAGHGNNHYRFHRHNTSTVHKQGIDIFKIFGHVWGEAGSAVGSSVRNPIERIGHDTQAVASVIQGERPHSRHNTARRSRYHVAANAAIYYASLKYDQTSYKEATIAGHNGPVTWNYDFPVIGPKAFLDCSGDANMAVYTASGGTIQLNENTVTERTDGNWKKIPFLRAGRGDLIQPVINGVVGQHVEIINQIEGNIVETEGAHTSHAPQPDQVGPARYKEDKRDIFLRYIGAGAPLGNHIRPQSSSHTQAHKKTVSPHKSYYDPQKLRRRGMW
jgi:flagellum-specific peptidoglycan hydrolase FlgJ